MQKTIFLAAFLITGNWAMSQSSDPIVNAFYDRKAKENSAKADVRAVSLKNPVSTDLSTAKSKKKNSSKSKALRNKKKTQ